MNRLSESRISHLAHLIIDSLRSEDFAEFPNRGRALADTKAVLHDFFQPEDHLEETVRRKIQSLSRHIPPGSREWDVLYRKYYEEELKRQRK